MKADLARREPEWLKRWQDEGQYQRLLDLRAEAEPFVLHDGPPYPTGGIHYGTLLNKVLKDIVVRSQLLLGKKAVFRPGWDCHGLPIEHQVEQEVLKERAAAAKASSEPAAPPRTDATFGFQKAGLSAPEFRARCEAHAYKYVDLMRTEFKRLGCLGTWDTPYLTLARDYEATIVRQLAGFARGGLLYRAKRPVQWSIAARTALAEAEVEYKDHKSPSIYVRFPICKGQPAVEKVFGDAAVSFVIWTTTPWTLPANLAVVANPKLTYVGLPVTLPGGTQEILVVAEGRAEAFLAAVAPMGISCEKETWKPINAAAFGTWEGTRYQHPFIAQPKTDKDFRLWFAAHATLEAGTGLVHTAPGHGADDYVVGRDHGLDIYAPVGEDGRFTAEVPQWAGLGVFEANPKVVLVLAETGFLLNKPGEMLEHSYPHCWRTKSPLIFRATSQWFARLGELSDAGSLRAKALKEIDKTQWIPAWGRDRISGMITVRPDWCLSRQRVWGVPIPAIRDKNTGEAFTSAAFMDHVAQIFETEGSNAWFTKPLSELLPANPGLPSHAPTRIEDMDKGNDIVDVWFESGVSWAAVAEGKLVPANQGEASKVDLYLEGADQHRGWFHSSLLASTATRGQAPYKAVLTHGWVLDERGKVYSKSEIAKARASGAKVDYVDPGEWMQKNGAELLRLWTGASDYQSDIVFSKTILDSLGESYRKLRNTCKYLLSNLFDFVPSRDTLDDFELREIDLLVLGVLRERDHHIREAYRTFSFHDAVRLMVDYVITVSAEYLDGVKDPLYCDAPNSQPRRSAQTVQYEIVRTLSTWMAPILCFTSQDVADELGRMTGEPFDVHGQVWRGQLPSGKQMGSPNKRWTDEIRPRRQAILKPLEAFRKAGHKSLHAQVFVTPTAAERPHWQWSLSHLTELCVVSSVEMDAQDAAGETVITICEATGPDCPRCWRRTGEASGHTVDPNLCKRCAAVIPQI